MAEHAETVGKGREPELEVDVNRRPWWQAMLIGAGALVLALALLGLIWLLAQPLALVLFGIVFAAALAPIVDWLDQWMPRIVAILLVYLLLIALFVGIGWLVLPPLVSEVRSFIGDVPDYIEEVETLLDESRFLDGGMLLDRLSGQITAVGGTLLTLPVTVGAALLNFALFLFVSLYWLVESASIKRFFLSLFPKRARDEVSDVLSEMGTSMGGYIRAVVIDALIIGALTYFGLLIVGVNYTLVLAVLMALGELVPFIGPILAGIPIVLVALLQSPTKGLIALGVVVVIQQIEGNIVTPNIMHETTKVSPLMVLVALFIGGEIGGLLGALLAVPLAAGARVFVNRVLAPAIRRQTGAAGDPVEMEDEGE